MPSTTASGGFLTAVTNLGDWIKTRLNNIDIFDEHYQNEAKTNPFYALGPIFYLVWVIVMLTGCVLIIWYIPTKPEAFDSIFRIQTVIPFGGLVRGMHKYGADAMIIAATMRLYRMFLMADFKPGKEFNIAIGLITLLLSMYSGLTGYLLIWNQRAFWATKVFATFPTYMDQFPVMGDFYQPLVKSLHMGWNTAEALLGGGAAITQETITRFFSLHLAFSLIPLVFVELYFYKNSFVRMPINWTKRTVVILMVAIVAIILPAAQGRRSNPDVTPLPILSDWYFLGLYQMYKYLEPVVATEITMLIPLSVIFLPFIDAWITGPEKGIMKRPVVLMTSIMGLLCWVIFSFLIIVNIANIHNDPPYWRDFLYLTIDVGIVWQLALMWMESDPIKSAKNIRPAIVLAIVAAIQSFWGWTYYYMARTEMFMSPLSQSFAYMLMRPFVGDSAKKAEDIVWQLGNADKGINKDYWNFHVLLDPASIKKLGEPAGNALLNQLNTIAQQPTPFDFIFKYFISTFEGPPHTQYLGFYDFVINNRWMFDYINFVNRMTQTHKISAGVVDGITQYYPKDVPTLDWGWMAGGALTMLFAILTAVYLATFRKPKPAPTATASTSATAPAGL